MRKWAVRARYLQHEGFTGFPNLSGGTDPGMFIP
ncbi:MAG: Uncharacterised protein [Halieaceae bacterium]|nr:MAG: Uncharacterised protein [Halieaceae bacterium]